MVLLKNKLIFYLIFMAAFAGCAKNFSANLQVPRMTPSEQGVDPINLDGSFIAENGNRVEVQSLAGRPFILFFVSETCSTCRRETESLLKLIQERGLPTQVQIYSVLIGSDVADIPGWKSTFAQTNFDWTLGADLDLDLYNRYFNELITPSVLYFDPQNSSLKRWQNGITIEELEKETQKWY